MHNKSGGEDWTKQETYGLKDVPESVSFLAGLIQDISSIEEATAFLGYLEKLFVQGGVNSTEMRDLTNELDRCVIRIVKDVAMVKNDIPRLETYRDRIFSFTQLSSIEVEAEIISILDHKIEELKKKDV